MRAGELRHRLTFQSVTRARNAEMEFVETWADYITVWGAVLPNAGRKYYEALQANAEVSGEVRVRYRSDIDATMRIKHGTRYLRIVSIKNPQERDREMVIYYREDLD